MGNGRHVKFPAKSMQEAAEPTFKGNASAVLDIKSMQSVSIVPRSCRLRGKCLLTSDPRLFQRLRCLFRAHVLNTQCCGPVGSNLTIEVSIVGVHSLARKLCSLNVDLRTKAGRASSHKDRHVA